jgi:hypothetical protein
MTQVLEVLRLPQKFLKPTGGSLHHKQSANLMAEPARWSNVLGVTQVDAIRDIDVISFSTLLIRLVGLKRGYSWMLLCIRLVRTTGSF